MKKIAIITIKDNNNLGNRLQNYAVQKIYEDMGFRAVTIKNSSRADSMNRYILYCVNFLKYIKERIEKIAVKKHSRKACFNSFDHKIKYSFHYICKQNAKKFLQKYDYISVGSDQVWNYKIGRMGDIELLKFTPREKNIAFSASAAVEEFPTERIEELKNAFNNFSHISVREEKTQMLISELTGRDDIEIFLDPTLLLSAEHWQEIEKKPYFLKEKFILIYFLREQTTEIYNEIKSYAKNCSVKLIDISPKGAESNIGPEEFLYLEHHAEFIFTDSFHACAFAINYNRPFCVYQRTDGQMYSRIESLLSHFHVENSSYGGRLNENNQFYAKTNKILEDDRKNTINILKTWIS